MKKYILSLTALLTVFSSLSQVSIKIKDDPTNIVYRGFNNILTISSSPSFSEDDYTLSCSNCSIQKTAGTDELPENVINLKTKGVGNAILTIEMKDGPVQEFIFRTKNLPVADLLINGIQNGGTLSETFGSEQWLLAIGYPPGIGLTIDADIISWECDFKVKHFASMSNELTSELVDAIRNSAIGEEITFFYVDLDNRSGIRRKKTASFRI